MRKKIINPYEGIEGYNCYGCAPHNPVGLHLEFWEDGDDIVCEWQPGDNHQSWKDTLHGGVISCLMDETTGWVINRKLQTTGVTSRLDVRYRRPVHTNEGKITLRGRITEMKHNIAIVRVTLEDSNGQLCDEAEATIFTFPQDKAREMGFNGCRVEGE